MNGCAGRSQSVPCSGIGNAFYSERVQQECVLDAARPQNLPQPIADGDVGGAIQNGISTPVVYGPQRSIECTGKGRGGGSAGLMPEPNTPGPTGLQHGMRTEGRMPQQAVPRLEMVAPTPESSAVSNGADGLQRALESELVEFLRKQNAHLLDELTAMRGKLDHLGAGVVPRSDGAISGASGNGSWELASGPTERQGRQGSRTPRSRTRVHVPSPERRVKNDGIRFTPNGTRVPDHPPPSDSPRVPAPPMPPFPTVNDDSKLEMYDTCESKPRAKNGDVAWKPCSERDVPSAAEAKQLWLAREGRAIQSVWDSIPVSPAFRNSAYWASGFEGRDNRFHGLPPDQAFDRQPWAGSRLEGDRALQRVLGDPRCQDRAFAAAAHGDHFEQGRAPAVLGDHQCHDRAFQHGPFHGEARAPALHGEHHDQGRAAFLHGDVPGRGRAPHQVDDGLHGLRDSGPRDSCHLPRHDGVGGDYGGGRPSPWSDGGVTNLNTKAELPDLPSTASPLQFGDWIHLSTPVLKDISSVSARWWELTWREAKAYYQDWQRSTPLARIQITPKLPDELGMPQYQRTEQRGVQMLLKAIPAAEQQALVTDRILSSTAILYKLLVRFQPGGAGEKQILLQQLTTMPKTTTVTEVAEALRNWRRHFGRALEVEAILPDGVLLLKALDGPIQQLGALDPQAAFRLAQSRMQLRLDEHPSQDTLWSFSQCLLAEAETLCLLQSTPEGPVTPLKLKQLDAATPSPQVPNASNASSSGQTGNNKGKGTGTADVPCKWFRGDQGCRAGKTCRFSHSWDGITDKNSRCWLCGSKEHRKQECKLRGGNPSSKPKPGESGANSGGGSGGGKEKSAASKQAPKPALNEMTSSTATTSPGSVETEASSAPKSSGNDDAKVNNKGDDGAKGVSEQLLHEATQLLKAMRGPTQTPKLNVMQVTQLAASDPAEKSWYLLDSGATHALRPACSREEWQDAHATTVMLAQGSTSQFRLKIGTRVLLTNPDNKEDEAFIVPMSGLPELGYVVEWTSGQCHVRHPKGRDLNVEVRSGCPMISQEDGREIIQQLEALQIHQLKKMLVVKALKDNPELLVGSLDVEAAITLKLQSLFPDLPMDILGRIVPDLSLMKSQDYGAVLPWNRRKRKRLAKARHVVLHLFSGPDHRFWEQRLSNSKTEVLCLDLQGPTKANLLDASVFSYVLAIAASGRLRCLIGGPPCRTVSALRYQGDNGPPVLRTPEHPTGFLSWLPLISSGSTRM